MDLLTDETQTFLQQAIADTVAHLAPLDVVRGWLDEGDLSPSDRLAEEQGWGGIGIAEDLGGQGGALQDLVIVAEQLGRGAVPWDLMLAGHLATVLLDETEEPGQRLARRIASGDARAVACFDARSLDTRTDIDVEGERVTGRAEFVLGASRADLLVVAVPARADGFDLVSVDRGAPGVSITPRRLVDRSRTLADVRFESAPAEALGTVSVERWLQMTLTGTVLRCADSLGAASRLLEMTTSYVRERHQFGVPVGSFQAVKHSAAQMLVDLEGIRSAVQYAAWSVETGTEDAVLQASVAGAFCSKAAPDLADRALFLHGAIGYTWEHDLHLLFKRIKSDAALFGSVEQHRGRIAAALGFMPSR